MQLTLPLRQVIETLQVGMSYTDAPSVNFVESSGEKAAAANFLNALLPAHLTFTSDGERNAHQFFFAPLEFIYNNLMWTHLHFGSLLNWPVGHVHVGNLEVVTLNGTPWQVNFLGPQGERLAGAAITVTEDGGMEFVPVNAPIPDEFAFLFATA